MPIDSAQAPTRQPLRVVLLIDSFTQPRWVADSVQDMLDSECLEIAGIVLNGAAEPWAPPIRRLSLPMRLVNAWKKRDAVLLDRYIRFDERRYPARRDDPFETVDLAARLEQVPRITALPRRTTFSDYVDDAALDAIRALSPDVAVRFGFRILRGPLLGIPRHGVWSFHHDDNQVIRGGPPGLWEVLLGRPDTGAVLQRLSEDLDAGETIARTWTATNAISVHQTRVALYRAAAPLLVRKLKDLHRRGPEALRTLPAEAAFRPYASRLYVSPTVRELSTGLVRVVMRLSARKLRQLRRREQWQLLAGIDSRQACDNATPQSSVFRLRRLVPPADRFWADPFPVLHDGRYFIFFEELLYSENVGRISVIEMSADGRTVSEPRVVLAPPFHVSYPFLFQHEGAWYMMPEMAVHGAQEIYRATEFPDRWEKHTTLTFDRMVVDPTLHFDGERWWLFVGTQASRHSDCDELSLFHGPTPLGPWQPHAGNPVVTDARCARPAGRLFRVGGELIRPAQDGTPGYGTAISFRRILRLDLEAYAEEPAGRIDPVWSPEVVGTHTVNAAGQLTVMDARVIRAR